MQLTPEDAMADWFHDPGERHLFKQWVKYLGGSPVMAPKEHLDQLGISVAPNGSLIVRYINGEGQKVTLDLSAIIEEKAAEAVKSHESRLHGHQI